MSWIRAESSWGWEAIGKAIPAMVQMGNTDLKARVLSREKTKEEALIVWDLKEALHQSSDG